MKPQPFLGTVSSFREAYSEVKTLRLEGKQRGELARESQSAVNYTESDLPQIIPCANPRCQQGGYDLFTSLSTVTHNRGTSYERELFCNGHEGSPQGRRRGDPCCNALKFSLALTYNEGSGA